MANNFKLNKQIFNVGDTVVVHQKIIEGEIAGSQTTKSRSQPFQGIIIAIKNQGEGKTFTVRKISTGGYGVERIWPVNSPWITKIMLKKRGLVRRAKLYFMRNRTGKAASKVKNK